MSWMTWRAFSMNSRNDGSNEWDDVASTVRQSLPRSAPRSAASRACPSPRDSHSSTSQLNVSTFWWLTMVGFSDKDGSGRAEKQQRRLRLS